MKNRILKKAAEYMITFLCIITLNFFIPRLMPGDPFTFLSSEEGSITVTYTQEQIEKYKAYYGLDKPLGEQYIQYIARLFKGDIGYSIYFNESVIKIIAKRAVWTVTIVAISILLSCFVGTVMGCLSAWHRSRWIDKMSYFMMIGFSEIPSFLVGVFLLFTFAARFGWFPLSGGMSVFIQYNTFFHKIFDVVNHAFLPVLTLSLARVGGFYLLSRNSMISVLSRDYMRTAKAKGLSNIYIIFRHALRNAMLPIITKVFLSLGTVFGGAILVENVFQYPGLGRLMRESVMVRDYVLIQGIFLFIAITVLTMNLLADILYRKIDPRVN